MKKLLIIVSIGLLSGLAGVWFGSQMVEERLEDILANNINSEKNPVFDRFEATSVKNNSANDINITDRPDFVNASEISTNSVVFITTLTEYEYRTGTMFDWFFEPRTSQRIGSGSGVVFTSDGYIVTNNHVIEDADEIRVTAGKRSYNAELIGRDPSSDLAVIKVKSVDLNAIPLGNSDEVKVGEWVLAVGNPFNLTSTVTAGIVSAKGRNINILKDKFPIESFIQTDAAINPGNSGGALVNQDGKLIGINTAILSRTGSYAGYGFAVPVNIVKKVFNDLVKYGEVQKAFTGFDLVDIDSEMANKLDLESFDGILVNSIQPEGAASKAGIEEGDIITDINGKGVESKAEFEEYIANLYPGDVVQLNIKRNGQTREFPLTLLNREGGVEILTREIYTSKKLDAQFERVSKVEKDLLQIKSGVKVIDYDNSGYFAQLELPKGFIITAINKRPVDDPEELSDILSKIKGRVEIYGIDTNGRRVYYPFYIR